MFFPGKPDWKPIQVTLFDLKTNTNPIFSWLKEQYDPCEDAGTWKRPGGNFKRTLNIEMYDGCGNTMERWIVRNAWPNNIEWGDLDMSESAYLVVELTLRYDRAWIDGC